MGEIMNFRRYFGESVPKCCSTNNHHWQFDVDRAARCECGVVFTCNISHNYVFCSNSHKIFCLTSNILGSSCHMKCPKNNIIKQCNRIIAEEIRCLYDKLRIITNYINSDCIRHTTILYACSVLIEIPSLRIATVFKI